MNDSHGDDRHITMDTVRDAAKASEISVDEAIRNMEDGLQQARKTSAAAD